jgi:hypothetical protein
MKEIRKKQRKLYKILKTLVIFTAVFMLAFIGAKPYIDAVSRIAGVAFNYVCDALVIISLAVVFSYYSKYGKADGLLKNAELKISDAGYYISARNPADINTIYNGILDDLSDYSVKKDYKVTDFTFDARAFRRALGSNELFYLVKAEKADKNDLISYLDEAQADIQMKSVIRRADAVVCIITDTLQPDAYALTKTMLRLGRKSETKIALCVYETDSNYVYFLGNDTTRCQKMIAETIMSTYIPYDDKYKSADKLPFQLELENELAEYTLNDFKDGKYNY